MFSESPAKEILGKSIPKIFMPGTKTMVDSLWWTHYCGGTTYKVILCNERLIWSCWWKICLIVMNSGKLNYNIFDGGIGNIKFRQLEYICGISQITEGSSRKYKCEALGLSREDGQNKNFYLLNPYESSLCCLSAVYIKIHKILKSCIQFRILYTNFACVLILY